MLEDLTNMCESRTEKSSRFLTQGKDYDLSKNQYQ